MEDHGVAIDERCDTRRERDLIDVNRVALIHARHIDGDAIREILRQALDFECTNDLLKKTAAGLDADRLAKSDDRHAGVHDFVFLERVKIEMDDVTLHRVMLNVLNQRERIRATFDLEVHEKMLGAAVQRHRQRMRVELQALW